MDKRVGGRVSRGVVLLSSGIVILTAAVAWAIVTDLGTVDSVHDPMAVHADQGELNALNARDPDAAFVEAFELGDELFGTLFNALDGSGANVGRGQRFTRVPRADLSGPTEWKSHFPARTTGPNAQGCLECHEQPFEDGSGTAANNVHRDPFGTGLIGQFVERNTPHVFAPGAIQRLAEEMTDDLTADQNRLVAAACAAGGATRSVTLETKGINYGTLSGRRTSGSSRNCTVANITFDASRVQGIDNTPSADNPTAGIQLIVRPFQWKGSQAFIRDFNRGASHNELGMQAVEVVGYDRDGDYDGVVNEMTIGDQTALAIYLAAQPRPTTLLELNSLGLLEPELTDADLQDQRGSSGLSVDGVCDVPRAEPDDRRTDLQRAEPEPVLPGRSDVPGRPEHRCRGGDARDGDQVRPHQRSAGQHHPHAERREIRLGSFRRNSRGGAIVELFGDLKRHFMGPRLREPVNEISGTDVTPIPDTPRNNHTPETFLTENLWGVGSTAPYLHDGRATTLAEAIIEHGMGGDNTSEGRFARANFINASTSQRAALIAYLDNLVLFKMEEEEEEARRRVHSACCRRPSGPGSG